MGFQEPSPIQSQALPLLLGQQTDFLGLAATGTGKTAAFAIPLIERIDPCKNKTQALILCPTRELALQVSRQIDLIGRHKGVRSLPIYGGTGYNEQLSGLRRGTPIVVGTPGRVIDHIKKGTLRLDQLEVLVLDEADEMISMGFKEALEEILKAVPRERTNTWLFSATMSSQIRKIADKYLNQPQQVQANRDEMVPTRIEQIYYLTREANKPEVLKKIIETADDFYGLVFCQTKATVTELTQYLIANNYQADGLQGDMNQASRENTMKAFRNRTIKILVCTDVASRGLDVEDVTHVINYSLPREIDSYVHRIGRTARSGKTGYAMSLVSRSHFHLIAKIERMTRSKLSEGTIPSRKEVASTKARKNLESFLAVEESHFHRALQVIKESWGDALADMPAEEVAARFMTMNDPDMFSGMNRPEAPPLKLVEDRPPSNRKRNARSSSKRPSDRRGAKARGPRGDRRDRRDSGRPKRSKSKSR